MQILDQLHSNNTDYYSKFPMVKKVNSLSADDLVKKARVIFAEYRVLKKMLQMLAQTSHRRHS